MYLLLYIGRRHLTVPVLMRKPGHLVTVVLITRDCLSLCTCFSLQGVCSFALLCLYTPSRHHPTDSGSAEMVLLKDLSSSLSTHCQVALYCLLLQLQGICTTFWPPKPPTRVVSYLSANLKSMYFLVYTFYSVLCYKDIYF